MSVGPQSQQSARQASIRAVTGSAESYEGDWHRLFDLAGIPANDGFNGRMLRWINGKLSASYTNLPEAMHALATANGAYNFSSMGTFDAGGAGPVSDILEAEVVGVTALDTLNTYGINGDSWLLRVRMLTLAGRNGPADGPDPSKFTVTVTAPGFDSAGVAAVRALTYTPMAILRRQSNTGTDLTLTTQLAMQAGALTAAPTTGVAVDYYLTMPGRVYSADTVSVSVDAGWYGAAAAGSGPAVTNNSTITYADYAAPLWGFMNTPHNRVEASTYAVEVVCYHRYARNAQAVAGVSLWATDGTNNGPVSSVNTPTLSAIQTREAIVETFAATVDLTGVNDTDGSNTIGVGIQTIDGYIYPWRGVRYQLSVDGVAWPTAQPCTPLTFVKDTAGKYGGAIAYVAPLAGASPAVSRTAAANKAAAYVAAYGSINLAAAALATFNNQTSGRPASPITHNNPHGSRIILLDSAGVADQAYELTGTYTPASTGNCWVDLESYSGNSFRAYYNTSATRRFDGGLLRLKCEVVKNGGGISANDTTANSTATMFATEGVAQSFGASTTTPLFQNVAFTYHLNPNLASSANIANALCAGLGGSGTSPLRCCKAIGFTYGDNTTATPATVAPYMMIGFTGRGTYADPTTARTSTNDGGIVDNCKMFAVAATLQAVVSTAWNIDRGFVWAQSIEEAVNTGGCNNAVSSTNATNNVRNFLVQHLTGTPTLGDVNDDRGGFSICYREQTVCLGHTADASIVGVLGTRFAMKSDYESVHNFAAGEGNVGNYPVKYGVDSRSNVMMIDRPSGSAVGGSPAVIAGTEFSWRACDPLTITNVGEIAFTSNLTRNKSWASGDGFGDYTLSGSGNLAKNRIAAGLAVRKYDLAGVLRKNDGTGAAGAFEATV